MASATDTPVDLGSPPHMRGTGLKRSWTRHITRITPAHAGNSNGFVIIGRKVGDHPRTCGEQLASMSVTFFNQGSPPHMRGTVDFFGFEFQEYRITPAHAGNSVKTSGRLFSMSGSPPHMRGTDSAQGIENGYSRITPAHAGNSIHR